MAVRTFQQGNYRVCLEGEDACTIIAFAKGACGVGWIQVSFNQVLRSMKDLWELRMYAHRSRSPRWLANGDVQAAKQEREDALEIGKRKRWVDSDLGASLRNRHLNPHLMQSPVSSVRGYCSEEERIVVQYHKKPAFYPG